MAKPKIDLLTTSQVAKLFSVAPHTIRRWAQDGLLKPARTVGGHLRFERNSVNQLLAARGFSVPDQVEEKIKTTSGTMVRVLVVDDEESVIEQIQKDLKGENVHIETARNGYEANVVIPLFKPQLIFLDLLLPDVEGFRICQEIRADEKTKDIYVVAMTGYSTEDFLSKAVAAGANECLPKPLDPKRIKEVTRDRARQIEIEAITRISTKPSAPREESSF